MKFFKLHHFGKSKFSSYYIKNTEIQIVLNLKKKNFILFILLFI